MSWLGDTLSGFTTGPAQAAAAAQTANLQAGNAAAQGDLTTGLGLSTNALNANNTNAVGAIGTGLGQANSALNAGFGAATSTIPSYYGSGIGAVYGGAGNASNLYGQAAGTWGAGTGAAVGSIYGGLPGYSNIYGQGNAGANSYADATGVNGPAGTSRALNAFEASPAFQSAQTLGTENVLRNEARTGQLASGKSNTDLDQFTTNLANQYYTQYVNQLQPWLNQENTGAGGIAGVGQAGGNAFLTGAGGQAGAYTGAAGTAANTGIQAGQLWSQGGNNLANLQATGGTALAGAATGASQYDASLYNQLGQNLATDYSGTYGNMANANYQTYAGIGNAQANADLAQYGATGNVISGIGAIGKLGSGLAGAGGWGTLAKGLGIGS